MVQPCLQEPDGLTRQIRRSSLPLGISLTTPNERLTGAVKKEVDIPDLKRCEFRLPTRFSDRPDLV